MARISPTQRTRKVIRDVPGCNQIVETFNHFSNTRRDLFGFADILQADLVSGSLIAIQVTGGGNLSARRRKILAERRALYWLVCGGRIEIHDWRKVKVKRGGKAVRYECRTEEIRLEDFVEEAAVWQ